MPDLSEIEKGFTEKERAVALYLAGLKHFLNWMKAHDREPSEDFSILLTDYGKAFPAAPQSVHEDYHNNLSLQRHLRLFASEN